MTSEHLGAGAIAGATAVVGGGVVGLSCAIELARRGRSVILFDRDEIGRGAGVGSAGHLVPSHVIPLAAPGMQLTAARALVTRQGSLSVDLATMARSPRWGYDFMRASREGPFESGARALVELAAISQERLTEVSTTHPGLHINRAGLLDVYADDRHRDEVDDAARRLARFGVRAEVVDADEARRLEPTLSGPIGCGLYFPDDASVRPADLLDVLVAEAADAGVDMRNGVDVLGINTTGERVEKLRTSAGDVAVDEVVFAVGAAAAPWQRQLGVRLPIVAGRGHSITLARDSIGVHQPLLLGEDHVAIGPYQDEVRISGWFELGAVGVTPSLQRTDALVAIARRRIELPADPHVLERWAGMRPVTPDGLPIVGRPGRWRNVVIAAGHSMVGLSFGPGTGRLVAELVTGETPSIDPAPFSPGRFATRRFAIPKLLTSRRPR